MKSFSRFIVTLIVLAVIGITAYYMIQNVDYHEEVPEIAGNQKVDEKIEVEKASGESSMIPTDIDDIDEENSGEEAEVETLEEFDEKLKVMYNSDILTTVGDKLSGDLLEEKLVNYIESEGLQSLDAIVNIRIQCIEVIPYLDFSNNMIYYYENGKLICYESISTNVEGRTRYYFQNNELIKIVDEYEEGIEPSHEEGNIILERANQIYAKYIN